MPSMKNSGCTPEGASSPNWRMSTLPCSSRTATAISSKCSGLEISLPLAVNSAALPSRSSSGSSTPLSRIANTAATIASVS